MMYPWLELNTEPRVSKSIFLTLSPNASSHLTLIQLYVYIITLTSDGKANGAFLTLCPKHARSKPIVLRYRGVLNTQ